jgi:hypothetical protein
VAVEKLAQQEFAEIASRQEALRTIFSSLLDIFYHPIFDFFRKTGFFNSHRIIASYLSLRLLVVSGLINTYPTFRKESTKDNLRIADNPPTDCKLWRL